MRSTSIYSVAHAKHTLNHLRFRGRNTTHELHAFPHSREKDASLGVTIPGSIQQASGRKLLRLHHQGTPQHDGSVESWVPQTSPWRPSRSQMTKNASRSRLVCQTSSPPYSAFLGCTGMLWKLVPEMSRYKVSALPISRSGSWTSPGQRQNETHC